MESKEQAGNEDTDTEEVVLIDCGTASIRTMGSSFQPFYEGGWPPFDRMFLH